MDPGISKTGLDSSTEELVRDKCARYFQAEPLAARDPLLEFSKGYSFATTSFRCKRISTISLRRLESSPSLYVHSSLQQKPTILYLLGFSTLQPRVLQINLDCVHKRLEGRSASFRILPRKL